MGLGFVSREKEKNYIRLRFASPRQVFFDKSTPKTGLNAQMFAKVRKYEPKRALKNTPKPRPEYKNKTK